MSEQQADFHVHTYHCKICDVKANDYYPFMCWNCGERVPGDKNCDWCVAQDKKWDDEPIRSS